MEDYEAKRLADSINDMIGMMGSGKKVLQEEAYEIGQQTRRLSSSLEKHGEKMDEYIESNESLAVEQQLNRATEQFISIKIAYKSKVLSAKEAGEMLLMSFRSLQTCYNRSSQPVKQKYSESLKGLLDKHKEFDKVLLAEEKKEEEFKF